jgi:predicted dehydrogenase
MDEVRLGIIGGGRVADLNILGYLDHPRCRVVAVCDLSEKVAHRRKEEWGADWYCTDYRELLASPEIDAVEILTPPRFHAPMVIEAARNRKHVSVQKPMCISLREADEMIQASRETGVKLKVFENAVFYPPYVKAKELIEAGAIGEPLSVNFKVGSGQGGWPVPLKTYLWNLDYKESGGGIQVYDDGFHRLSLARYLFGEIESTKAWIEFSLGVIDAPAMVTWSYRDSPVLGVWEINIAPAMLVKSKYYPADERVEILGTDGYIWVTRCTAQIMEVPPLILYRDGQSRAYDDMRDDWGDSFHDSGGHFIDCILEDRDPFLTGADGRALMQFWLAIERSYREGREVRLAEVAP